VPDYTYLIVGGGVAAAAAITGIREIDHTGLHRCHHSQAVHPPYNRPPLSKWLWRGRWLRSIWWKANSSAVTFHQSRAARALDPQTKQVTDDHGDVYHFRQAAPGHRLRAAPPAIWR